MWLLFSLCFCFLELFILFYYYTASVPIKMSLGALQKPMARSLQQTTMARKDSPLTLSMTRLIWGTLLLMAEGGEMHPSNTYINIQIY